MPLDYQTGICIWGREDWGLDFICHFTILHWILIMTPDKNLRKMYSKFRIIFKLLTSGISISNCNLYNFKISLGNMYIISIFSIIWIKLLILILEKILNWFKRNQCIIDEELSFWLLPIADITGTPLHFSLKYSNDMFYIFFFNIWKFKSKLSHDKTLICLF